MRPFTHSSESTPLSHWSPRGSWRLQHIFPAWSWLHVDFLWWLREIFQISTQIQNPWAYLGHQQKTSLPNLSLYIWFWKAIFFLWSLIHQVSIAYFEHPFVEFCWTRLHRTQRILITFFSGFSSGYLCLTVCQKNQSPLGTCLVKKSRVSKFRVPRNKFDANITFINNFEIKLPNP